MTPRSPQSAGAVRGVPGDDELALSGKAIEVADRVRPVLPRFRPSAETLFMFISPLLLLLLWEVAARSGWMDTRIFSSPSGVARLAWGMLLDGSLLAHFEATMVRFVVGTVAGLVPGLALGLTMGLFRWPRIVLNPLVAAIYPLPRIAIFPLVLLVVGLNETSNVIMIALQPFFYMLIGSMAAVQGIEPIYLRVARSYGSTTRDVYRLIVLPAAMPIILSSLRISIGGALLVTVTVESLVCQNGIGYLIWHSWQTLSLEQAMVGLVVAGLVGFALIQLLDRLETKLVPWSQTANRRPV